MQSLSDKVPISVDAQPTPCYLLRPQLFPDAMPICRAAGAISLILIQGFRPFPNLYYLEFAGIFLNKSIYSVTFVLFLTYQNAYENQIFFPPWPRHPLCISTVSSMLKP